MDQTSHMNTTSAVLNSRGAWATSEKQVQGAPPHPPTPRAGAQAQGCATGPVLGTPRLPVGMLSGNPALLTRGLFRGTSVWSSLIFQAL